MTTDMMSDEKHPVCPECGSQTVMLKGSGYDTQFRVCPLFKEPGHLTEDEIKERLAVIRQRLRPSGRFA